METMNATPNAVDASSQGADAPNPAVAAMPASAAPVTSSIPQVGDLTAQGAVFGVRRHSDGLVEISFNGIDWQPCDAAG